MIEKNTQVTVNFLNTPDLYNYLEKMVAENITDRSKLIKKLIAQEISRWQRTAPPFHILTKRIIATWGHNDGGCINDAPLLQC